MFEWINALPGPLATAFYFAISLFPLVLVHELGHFAAAKLGRVRVDEFGFGFPPRLLRVARIGETEYTINALPLGGFVKLAGEDDPDVPGAFASRSKRVRAFVLLAGPVANFALAALIFAGLAWSGLIPEPLYGLDGVRVTRVTEGSPAAEAGLQPEDIIVAVEGSALATDDVAPGPARAERAVTSLVEHTDASAGAPMALTVLRATLLRLPADASLAGVETEAADLEGVEGRRVVEAPAGAPVEEGDILVDIWSASGETTAAAAVALRGAEIVSLSVVPESAAPGEPARMGVQISAPSIPARYGLLQGLVHGARFTVDVLHAMVTALARMFVGQQEVQLAGPVGISIMSREMGQQGMIALLEFMALLSLNLGLINLLPIPALDGGRLLFIGAEAVRGKRIEPSREAVVHLIGFVAVIGLMGVLTLMEVARLTGITGP